jgi:hypothetical protein
MTAAPDAAGSRAFGPAAKQTALARMRRVSDLLIAAHDS